MPKSSNPNPSKPKGSPPNWPRFKPPLPILPSLSLNPHPSSPTKILLLPSFFPRSLCRDYVTFLKTLPLQTTPAPPRLARKKDLLAARVNDRFQIDDPGFSRRLWEETGLREAVLGSQDGEELWNGQPVGLSPNIRVYRYSKGQYFDCHYDDSNSLILPSNPPIPVKTTWTLLLYLTSSAEGCIGGETVFYLHDRKLKKEEIVVPPETGMLLLHKHGDDCLFHEGREVLDGEKWILRTDLCVKR